MFDLFIFDLDDTLIQTEDFHYSAWVNVLSTFKNFSLKGALSRDTFFQIFHSLHNPHDIESYLSSFDLPVSYQELKILKKNEYIRILQNNDLQMTKGAHSLILNIINHNKKFVIVTNTSYDILSIVLLKFPILLLASKLYYSSPHVLPKPNSQCYMNVVNDFPLLSKVAFEDSLIGIHALSQVSEITPFFINNEQYYYKPYILSNYHISFIPDFNHFHFCL